MTQFDSDFVAQDEIDDVDPEGLFEILSESETDTAFVIRYNEKGIEKEMSYIKADTPHASMENLRHAVMLNVQVGEAVSRRAGNAPSEPGEFTPLASVVAQDSDEEDNEDDDGDGELGQV